MKGTYTTECFSNRELTHQQDIVYATVPNFERIQYSSDTRKDEGTGTVELDLHLDLVNPPNATEARPRPLMIIVHGGAFSGGAKEYRLDLAQSYARHGYIAATVDYRLTPLAFQDMQPANRIMAVVHAVEDLMNAVRFLKTKADTFHIDADRIAIIGLSAGGIAAMVNAVAYDAFMGAKNAFPGVSSRVAAVVSSGASLFVDPRIDPTAFIQILPETTPVLLFHARHRDSTVGTTWDGHALKTCEMIVKNGGRCKNVPQAHLTHVSDMSASGLHWTEINAFLMEELRLNET